MNTKKFLQAFCAVLLAMLLFFAIAPLKSYSASADSNQVISDGTYYIRNAKKSGDDALYVQQDNDTMSSYYNNGNIVELFKYGGTESQRWTFTYLNNGYYKAISKRSGKALAIKSGNENKDDQALILEDYSGSYRQQWNLEKRPNGNYLFRCRASDVYRSSTDWCMSGGDGIYGEGLNVEQKKRADDSDYIDEWQIESIKDNAIVIVPGIIGSELINQSSNNELVWLKNGKDNQLICSEEGVSEYNICSFNSDNYGTHDEYKTIFKALNETYKTKSDVIFFDYDWRMTCAEAGYKLEEELSEYDSCILVAHSMGGLVASSYLARSAANRNKTTKFISVGTPFTGTAKAIDVIETGSMSFWLDIITELKLYAKNIPAVYELLPTRQYFNQYSSVIHKVGGYIIGYNRSNAFLKNLSWALKTDGSVKPMFDEAENFHYSLYINGTHVAELSSVDTYKIYGTSKDTKMQIFYDSDNEIDSYQSTTLGDGTVPIYSALNNKTVGTEKTYSYKLSHMDLIKNSEAIALIKEIIDGTASIYQNLTKAINTIDDTENDALRITMVTKNIKSISVYNGEGYELYSQGEKLYYDDLNGVTHEGGTIWYINDTSYQYILYNDSYTVKSIEFCENPSIRIDYCDYGLSDNMVKFTEFTKNSVISIDKRNALSSTENGIVIGE